MSAQTSSAAHDPAVVTEAPAAAGAPPGPVIEHTPAPVTGTQAAAGQPSTAPTRRGTVVAVIIAALAAGAGVAGALWYLKQSEKRIADAAAAVAAARPQTPGNANEVPSVVANRLKVTTAKVVRQPLARDLEVVGTVVFDQDKVAIAGPRLGGRILKLHARPGDLVQEGAPLAEIESVELGRAEAKYLALRARARAAASNARRERELAAKHVSSARDRETAEADAYALEAEVKAAQALLQALGLKKGELPGRGSRLLAHYWVRAPITGLVVERKAALGEAVESGRNLYKIADLSTVWVRLDIYERDLAWVQPGLPAELYTEAFMGTIFKAKVRYIGAHIDEQTRAARVYLDVSNPDAKLRPGQFVTARLRSQGAGPPALVVPRDAVQSVEGKSVVFVQKSDGGFVMREVKLGSSGTTHTEIRKGLSEGEKVAVENAFLLKSEVLR